MYSFSRPPYKAQQISVCHPRTSTHCSSSFGSQKVYLLDAGDMMYDFTWELFDKIRHNEDWKDSLSLNLSLHECLEKTLQTNVSRYVFTQGLVLAKLFSIGIH